MGWYNYYKLLEKYVGDLDKASKKELREASLANPDNASAALEIAKKKWRIKEDKALAQLAKQEMFGPDADMLPDDMGCK